MAIRVDHLTGDGTIRVIARIDGALKYEEEAYSTYLKTNDESVLSFEEGQEPTRFVLRKTISFKTSQKFKANQIRMEKENIYFNTGVTAEEVRYALCDIEVPLVESGTPLKFDGTKIDAGKAGSMVIASDKTMDLLSQLGVIDDLYTARRNFIENGGANVKKSSSPSLSSATPTAHV